MSVRMSRIRSDYFSRVGFAVGILCLVASPKTLAQAESPTVEWEKTFGGTESDTALSAQQTADDGYIVAGRTGGRFNGDDQDAYVIKLDDEYKVLLNEEGLPRLRISPVYRRMVNKAAFGDTNLTRGSGDKPKNADGSNR